MPTRRSYQPENAIGDIGALIATPVEPADFPRLTLRYRNPRWDAAVGLSGLSDDDWLAHFGRFKPLPDNLEAPLALAYHGHQFGSYNPDIGDGRGFLFAQLRDEGGRILDLGTKGSGQTPYSRFGDGRLTLKGGVREVLAANLLEARGVNTSKPFSLIETGEELSRGDEPSPTRSSVLVRLSHSHIRFGTFQRLAYLDDADGMAQLLDHAVNRYQPEARRASTAETAAAFLEAVARDTADMIASWMAAGFVHGVMNTDNMVVTGETFDFGPYRFLPASDPNFVAAYFDQAGRYRFGRQPATGLWNLSQLGGCLTMLSPTPPLEAALGAYEGAYASALQRHVLGRLGLQLGDDLAADVQFIQSLLDWMTASGAGWEQTFFDWFCGSASEARANAGPQAHLYREEAFAPVKRELMKRLPAAASRLEHDYFSSTRPADLLIDDIEALWSSVDKEDDWSMFERALARIETARQAYE